MDRDTMRRALQDPRRGRRRRRRHARHAAPAARTRAGAGPSPRQLQRRAREDRDGLRLPDGQRRA